MSYTNVEQVRHHLVTPYPRLDRMADQAVIMADVEAVRFFEGAVEASGVVVKSLQTNTATRIVITLGETTSISAQPLVPGSVVVASDTSLGTIYTANIDYTLDYAAGEMILKDGGALSAGDQVAIWMVPYTVYVTGSDYSLDAVSGKIRRLAGGDIAPGETVYLDYSPVYSSFAEALLTNAVAMANGLVEREVDPEGEFEVDPTLGAAATYRALEIVCRAAASRELASLRGEDRAALAWIKLADEYGSRSDLLLRAFRPPFAGPRTPVHG